MDRIVVEGGARLSGEVTVSGSKNSTLALMAAALLVDGETLLHNVPRLRDTDGMLEILRALGVDADWTAPDEHSVRIDASKLSKSEAPYELVRKMRASFLVLGPLLARLGTARVSEPGGCAIGVRPIDQHLKGLLALGGKVRLDHGYVEATASEGLVGGRLAFDLNTVNGTQNVLMAATLARGQSVIENAAREPEIVDLARCLRKMGAEIEGEGTGTITIQGVDQLHGATHPVVTDRIELGTYMLAPAICGGEVELLGGRLDLVGAFAEKLDEAGIEVTETDKGLKVRRRSDHVKAVNVTTAPFPGFPTDLQAQMMALMCTADGVSVLEEKIFENRFMHAPELMRMGAQIDVHGGTATVTGVDRLKGAQVMATDLRASVSLILAGMAADGDTTVGRVYHLDRGYEHVVRKLQSVGAKIERIKGQ